MIHVIPVGTSEPQDFALFNDGVALDGTGLSVALDIFTDEGESFSPAPTVVWLDQSAGTVRVTDTDGLTVGMYRVRFALTDNASQKGFAPNGQPAMFWDVVAEWV